MGKLFYDKKLLEKTELPSSPYNRDRCFVARIQGFPERFSTVGIHLTRLMGHIDGLPHANKLYFPVNAKKQRLRAVFSCTQTQSVPLKGNGCFFQFL
ncbi:hypothetical protein SAMN05192534_10375 [Alteribacillus persepolensis]|uniref:Uncharacterized protein n=1 Tax=Alteribacillus persepolensis TaxID=568899 RepID=A0A1G8AZ49_9BACI|nr:hypothetical protein [Alteribacillus persepolensis]SDH26126.1 hypothetical protein SAMN05192534_10375 [Alteribacillus persepolensis]